MKYTIEVDRKACIGAAPCTHVFPERLRMDDSAGKVDLIDDGKKVSTVEINEHEIDRMMEAAQSCPVNAIHITDEKKERLI